MSTTHRAGIRLVKHGLVKVEQSKYCTGDEFVRDSDAPLAAGRRTTQKKQQQQAPRGAVPPAAAGGEHFGKLCLFL